MGLTELAMEEGGTTTTLVRGHKKMFRPGIPFLGCGGNVRGSPSLKISSRDPFPAIFLMTISALENHFVSSLNETKFLFS